MKKSIDVAIVIVVLLILVYLKDMASTIAVIERVGSRSLC